MARVARIVVAGEPHHVTHRGNNGQDIFAHPSDRVAYMRFLVEACRTAEVSVHAYCLMTNHIHLLVTPAAEESLGLAMGNTAQRYALYFNDRLARTGHLWESRFYSCVLDGEHFWRAARYVECNPVRAGMVALACGYPWSSAAAHTGRGAWAAFLDTSPWNEGTTPSEWEHVLMAVQPGAELGRLREATRRGLPLGDEAFVERLETRLGRSLRPRPKGRPRK